MEKRTTESGKSYWNENGAYQEEYDKLYKELVPSRGEADSIHGEMIRAVSRLFYDFCNNGNCNVRDFEQDTCDECGGSGYEEEESTCWTCDGSGEVDEYNDDDECIGTQTCDECNGDGHEIETMDCSYCGGDCYVQGDVVIGEYYQEMIDFLHENLKENKVVVDNLEEFLLRTDIGYGTYKFDDAEMKVYNDLVDEVVYQTLTRPNQKRIKKDLVD